LLTDDELQRVKRARAARLDVIEVDDFAPDLGLSTPEYVDELKEQTA